MLFVVYGEPGCGTLPECRRAQLHQSISASAVSSPPKLLHQPPPPPFSSLLDLSPLSCLAASLPCGEREEEEEEDEEEDIDKKKLVEANLISPDFGFR